MNTRSVVSHKQKLDALFDRARGLEDETLAHWSRYLCVLVSGFIEESVRSIVARFIAARATPEVAQFAGRRVRSFTNASMEKILDLLAEFDTAYREQVETAVDDERRSAVDSVVANRHQIAHGKDIGISFVTIRKYYINTVKVIEEIDRALA